MKNGLRSLRKKQRLLKWMDEKDDGKNKTGAGAARAADGKDFYLAAHQLRAPLSAMQTVLKLVLEGGISDPEKLIGLVRQAYTRSEDMMRLLNDVLDLGEARSAYERMSEGTCAPGDVLEGVVERLAPAAAERGMEIKLHIGDTPEMRIGAAALEHIFSNLLDNAIKYGRENGAVEVYLDEDPAGTLLFRVRDDGLGIPAEWLEKIFDDFQRAPNARKAVKQGTGLGLPIVKELAERAGGGISVESGPEKGTFFTVRLPVE